jgi:hypothetical protein
MTRSSAGEGSRCDADLQAPSGFPQPIPPLRIWQRLSLLQRRKKGTGGKKVCIHATRNGGTIPEKWLLRISKNLTLYKIKTGLEGEYKVVRVHDTAI